ncbi:hypothetical protein BJX61DRAFT_552506 [Aspergillus egyptiacus]|nr:hypothetical protein BJX61DRAFT_552506 [Aspergillus egyptiacus]
MALFKCTLCDESIPPTKPRLSCASCLPRMTLCANCHLVGHYPPQHQDDASHEVSLHKYSGYLPVPPPPPPRPAPARSLSISIPPTRKPTRAAPYSEVPPRKPPRPGQQPAQNESNDDSAPVPGPPEETPQTEPDPQPQRAPTGWTPLLNEDRRPSASFLRLADELFARLDPQHTGYLSPEVYSDYLDACGAPMHHNIWKSTLSQTPLNSHDTADRDLTDHFTSFGVDFTLHPRRRSHSWSTTSRLNPLSYFSPSRITMPSLSGGQKPMLSRRGWTDLTVCGMLINPSGAWAQLSRVMQQWRLPVWTEWGDLPREMLPLAPYGPEVERVRVLMEGARGTAEREMDAMRARMEMEGSGRRAALDLLDDRFWVYR